MDKKEQINKNIGTAFGLGIFKMMLRENIISEKEYENMTNEFEKQMKIKTRPV